ncbi:hypothetical protein GPECTOR_46g257 [Gonium pectorale]|uniref:Peptidase S8/S53 domain-containing protein n=1 Tax=Gonium pectorale TaxID=33097 RepID=A0A150G8N9_GONPE|nr:hypothetical protein GPECTOR_46g257 [Gonium pectorale]|eukprot:KXZ46188.1 hypothetical protein GPECTOR_46g257 [Gonium pectorale]
MRVELLPAVNRAALEAAEADWPRALAVHLGMDPAQEAPEVPASDGSASGGAPGAVSAAASEATPAATLEQAECWPVVEAPRGSDGAVLAAGPPVLLEVFLCAEHLASAVSWLASQPVVKWVEPRQRAQRADAVSSILMQTGGITREQYDAPLEVPLPYWEAGVDGRGEIVGVTDGGLDLSSCYLYDPSYGSIRPNASQATGPAVLPLPGHRKVVQYALTSGATFGDAESAHGTHVCGSVAGARLLQEGGGGGGNRDSAAGTGPPPFERDVGTGGAPRSQLSFIGLAEDNRAFTMPPRPDTMVLQALIVPALSTSRVTKRPV